MSNKLKWALMSGVVVLVSIASSAYGVPPAPTGLLVNGVDRPLATDRDTIRFTWALADNARDETQTAYQILVYSNSLAADQPLSTPVWWDSGKVDSRQSASVEYAGKALPAAARFWWKVRVWGQTGKPGLYSRPARFDTGLNQRDWTAHYIWDGTTNVNNFAYFRKTFSVTDVPALAKVYVSAHDEYLLYFNGQKIGRGPARCDPYHYGQYNAYDITRWVRPGANVLAAKVHWQGTFGDSGVSAQPAFLLEARLSSPNGATATIDSDASWKVLAQTPFIETDPVYFGGTAGSRNRSAIQFDSRMEPADWTSAGFDDSHWASATVVDRSSFRLFAQMAPLEREQAALKPVSIALTNGAWLVDFGRCIDGWPKITMHENRPGDVVRIEYFQMTGQRKPAGWDEYICHGGEETWDAKFGRHTSFQTLKITGYSGKLKASDVRGMWAYSDADVEGRFHCSSPLLNDIYKMCERSARQNVQQAIISVDADREQSPWTADSWNIGNVLLYNDSDTMMMDKVVRDYATEQLSFGDFPCCCPARRPADYTPPGPKSRRIPEWSMYWPMLLWQQYLFSGDETLLAEMAPHLTRFLDWISQFQDAATGLPIPPGWRISDYAGGNMPDGGLNAATSCQYYENLLIASRVFSILNRPNQSANYLRQADAVKAAINAHLFNGRYYLARTDRTGMFPLASAWALRFDIEPASDKAEILNAIEGPGKPNIGGYGGDAFYSGLFNAGGGAFATRDLARYRPMLEGNKANWETWNTSGEVNHAWTSYPGYIFLKYVCGIQPTSGGFATFDVRPDISGLAFAEGTVPTVKGLIRTSWKKDGRGGLSLRVSVPANTSASIYIPQCDGNRFTVTESGRQIWPDRGINDPGVLAVSRQDSSIRCVVGGGDYRFRETP